MRWSIVWRLGGPVIWCAAVALLTLQPAMRTLEVGLDPSWEVGLEMAFRQHLQWGTQVIWTFGPYGFAFLPTRYFTDTWLLGLVFKMVVHAAFVGALAAYLLRLGARPWAWLLVGGLFLFPIAQFLTLETEGEIAALLLLYLAATARGTRRAIPPAVLAGCLIALLLTVKDTGMAVAAAFVIVFGAALVAGRRPLGLLPLLASMAVAIAVLWIAAGQSLGNLYAYFRSSYEIIAGYTAAMSVLHEYRPTFVPEQAAFGALIVLSTSGLLAWALWRRERRLACLLLLALPLLFATYRHGYVRFGNQVFLYALAVVVEALVVLHLVRPGMRPRAVALQPAAVAAASLLLLSGVGYASGAVSPQPKWPVPSLADRLGSYRTAASLLVHADRRHALAAADMARIRAADPLTPETVARLSTGRTDVWPWNIELAYAYALPWAPRPVLQSYSAYTPYLDAADAAYFEGPDAPDQVLVGVASVDGRYAPFDEPAAFRALCERYEVVSQDADFLVLSRRGASATARLRPFQVVHARLGDVVTVPADAGGPVYASLSVPYSLRGQLMNAVFQPGELHVDLRLADGTVAPHRFIPRVALDGLMLDTYIGSAADLRSYLEGGRDRPIRAIRITSDQPRDYAGRVDVTFSTYA